MTMSKIRTTLTIDESVMKAVKMRGDSQVIEDSLRRDLGLDLLERLWEMQDNAKLSRSLRPPTRQIAAGLQAFVDGGAIIREWADRARRLLKDEDSSG